MTHNQIDYWKMRNDLFLREAQNRETQRYNKVQEELKRIDQDLQRDLMAINERYQNKQLELARDELGWKVKYQTRQLDNDQRRNEINLFSATISQRAQQETERANRVSEGLRQQSINIDKAMLPLNQALARSNTAKNQASKELMRNQAKTELYRPGNVQSSTFSNFASPIINLAGTVLRVATAK